jgi:DNA-binding NarL/FixJ family response regulator
VTKSDDIRRVEVKGSSGAAKTVELTDGEVNNSEREKEVLTLIAKGYSNKEIAEQLIISVKTVETHKSNVMEKLQMKTRPELVEYALKKGLLSFGL